jgi:hypothetical protein
MVGVVDDRRRAAVVHPALAMHLCARVEYKEYRSASLFCAGGPGLSTEVTRLLGDRSHGSGVGEAENCLLLVEVGRRIVVELMEA